MFSENIEINKKFLALFTTELIQNSNPNLFLEIKKKLEEKEKLIQPIKFQEPFQKKLVGQKNPILQRPKIFARNNSENQNKKSERKFEKKIPLRRLTIPEPKLPEKFRYLRPTPQTVAIDLGKLNRFLVDPKIRTIECTGAEEPIILNANAQNNTTTDLLLTKEEISDVIKTFSIMSKIPAEEGVYQVIVGNLTLSAVISESIGSRFIIRKMNSLPQRPVMRR